MFCIKVRAARSGSVFLNWTIAPQRTKDDKRIMEIMVMKKSAQSLGSIALCSMAACSIAKSDGLQAMRRCLAIDGRERRTCRPTSVREPWICHRNSFVKALAIWGAAFGSSLTFLHIFVLDILSFGLFASDASPSRAWLLNPLLGCNVVVVNLLLFEFLCFHFQNGAARELKSLPSTTPKSLMFCNVLHTLLNYFTFSTQFQFPYIGAEVFVVWPRNTQVCNGCTGSGPGDWAVMIICS